jgi:hypothetical protein
MDEIYSEEIAKAVPSPVKGISGAREGEELRRVIVIAGNEPLPGQPNSKIYVTQLGIFFKKSSW